MKKLRIWSLLAVFVVIVVFVFMEQERRHLESHAMSRISDDIFSAASLYSVLVRLQPHEISTNWSQMVEIAKAGFIKNGRVPFEFISRTNTISTNLTGQGGWWYDCDRQRLGLNLTNPIKFQYHGESIELSPDYFYVMHSQVFVAERGIQPSHIADRLAISREKATFMIQWELDEDSRSH